MLFYYFYFFYLKSKSYLQKDYLTKHISQNTKMVTLEGCVRSPNLIIAVVETFLFLHEVCLLFN